MTLSRMTSSGRIATLALSTIIGAWLSAAALAQNAEPTSTTPEVPTVAQSAEKSATSAKCLVAEVNPVTGHPVCINPRGAPVEAPPLSSLHPCKPRPHDNEPWTVYEHWSGC
jgi:hypothetical protein